METKQIGILLKRLIPADLVKQVITYGKEEYCYTCQSFRLSYLEVFRQCAHCRRKSVIHMIRLNLLLLVLLWSHAVWFPVVWWLCSPWKGAACLYGIAFILCMFCSKSSMYMNQRDLILGHVFFPLGLTGPLVVLYALYHYTFLESFVLTLYNCLYPVFFPLLTLYGLLELVVYSLVFWKMEFL